MGSNLGDRGGHLDFALSRLASLLSDIRTSPRYETAPVDTPGDQPLYLNAAVVGRTSLSAPDLLVALHQIEAERGRERPYVNAPRTLDLDLILYGDLVLVCDGIEVPHPRFRERPFVLRPLADVAPSMTDPVTGLTVAALLARLGGRLG